MRDGTPDCRDVIHHQDFCHAALLQLSHQGCQTGPTSILTALTLRYGQGLEKEVSNTQVKDMEKHMDLDLPPLTAEQFTKLGMPHIAYMRPILVGKSRGFAVCSADGRTIDVAPTIEEAAFSADQHELLLVAVH